MCKRGNQSIFHKCRLEMLKITGQTSMTNQEMCRLLKKYGGCMNGAAPAHLDNKLRKV